MSKWLFLILLQLIITSLAMANWDRILPPNTPVVFSDRIFEFQFAGDAAKYTAVMIYYDPESGHASSDTSLI